jgi:hypothetical protein
MKTIKWKVIEVEVSKVKPTPGNFKLKTEDGSARFKTSVDNFGLAGSIVINTDYVLIDGNTRLEKAKELGHKKIWASIPDRKLTPKEFKTFAAMYDFARAGEVDTKRIAEELGTTESFFKQWGMQIPMEAVKALEQLEQNENNVTPNAKKAEVKTEANLFRPVTLAFKASEADEFLNLAEKLYAKFKVNNVTDLSLKAFKYLATGIK